VSDGWDIRDKAGRKVGEIRPAGRDYSSGVVNFIGGLWLVGLVVVAVGTILGSIKNIIVLVVWFLIFGGIAALALGFRAVVESPIARAIFGIISLVSLSIAIFGDLIAASQIYTACKSAPDIDRTVCLLSKLPHEVNTR
jgi:hypothetical protein